MQARWVSIVFFHHCTHRSRNPRIDRCARVEIQIDAPHKLRPPLLYRVTLRSIQPYTKSSPSTQIHRSGWKRVPGINGNEIPNTDDVEVIKRTRRESADHDCVC